MTEPSSAPTGAGPPRRAKYSWLILAVPAVPAVGFILFHTPEHDPEAQEIWVKREAIKECWKMQERKSLTPETQRFVAGACERAEAEFAAHYGRKP